MAIRYLRLTDLIGQAAITPEEAAANKAAKKWPRRPRAAKPGILPVSAATVWRMVRRGELPPPVHLSDGVTAWEETALVKAIATRGQRTRETA